MKHLILLIIPSLLLSCSHPPPDHSRDPWLPVYPAQWSTTPDGHARGADPLGSVQAGWETESEIDSAVDLGFQKFYAAFPEFSGLEASVAFVDDYVMWIGQWAGGYHPEGQSLIYVCLWSKDVSPLPPGPCWKCYAPGEAYNVTSEYHFTGRPLCPAVMHELLHVAIGDPNHLNARWKLVN